MKCRAIGAVVLTLCLLPVAAVAQRADEPGAASRAASQPAAAPTTRPAPAAATRAAPAARQTEYRFDALRVDGQLHGPEALVVHGMAHASRSRLLKVRRSFLHRILETVEDPCLHRGGTH